jgi:C-1 hydroxylase
MSISVAPVSVEANKAIVRSFIDAWNSRDFERFGELMGDGAVLHIAGGVVPCDPSGTRAIAIEWTAAFPDWRFDLQSLVAEGDLVVAHMPYSGTHRQAIVGVPATGRSCVVDEIVIFRIGSGKIAEAWEVYDEAGMWRQLGVTPPPLE